MTAVSGAGKRFVVIFEPLQSVHLHKDVGQVPFQLFKHYGYRSEIVCRKNEERYLYLDAELKGLHLTFLDDGPQAYLRRHAAEIDALMLFHISTQTLKLGMLYKRLNPRGFLYVKYDLREPEILYATWGHRNFITQAKRNFLFARFKRSLDLLSVECEQVFRKMDKIPERQRVLIPNGFDPDIAAYHGVVPKPFAEKEDLLILVGRHGTPEKNSELLLQALSLMGDIGGWQVLFVGPVTEEFERQYREFVAAHPYLADKVRCVGNVSDKGELFEYYNRAKIFCLPSRVECFPLVGPEALFFGNVLVMTRELVAAYDLTEDGRTGFQAPSEDAPAWASVLKPLLADQELLAQRSARATALFQDRFVWKKVLAPLHQRLQSPDASR